jgi:HD superfamily phosphohydrolase
MEQQYNDVPFHNSMHATDVAIGMMYLIRHSPIFDLISTIELNAALIAAFCHDIGHTGFTNRHVVEENGKAAQRYNDRSVLENMQCATIFKFLSKAKYNLLDLEDEEWR